MPLILRLQKAAFRRFLDGKPGPWGALAIFAFGFRMLARLAKRNEEVVYRTELKPGETVSIVHSDVTVGASNKAKGRKAKRRAKNT